LNLAYITGWHSCRPAYSGFYLCWKGRWETRYYMAVSFNIWKIRKERCKKSNS